MPAEDVRPSVKSNKNDYVDAEAIAEAVQRPTIRFVPMKSEGQLDLQALHRVRHRWICQKTAVINQLRGFLLEHGITVSVGPAHLKRQIPSILEDAENLLSPGMRTLLVELRDEWVKLEEQIDASTRELAQLAEKEDSCRGLLTIPGVSPLTATALTAAIGNGAAFRKSRDLAAWLGLLPKQHWTGGKARLLGISKRGDPYLRRLFVHGERHPFGSWLNRLEARSPRNVVIVAMANKIARMGSLTIVRNFLICVWGSSLAPPVMTQTKTNFLPTSIPAHRSRIASIIYFSSADKQPAAGWTYCSTGSEEAPVRCT